MPWSRRPESQTFSLCEVCSSPLLTPLFLCSQKLSKQSEAMTELKPPPTHTHTHFPHLEGPEFPLHGAGPPLWHTDSFTSCETTFERWPGPPQLLPQHSRRFSLSLFRAWRRKTTWATLVTFYFLIIFLLNWITWWGSKSGILKSTALGRVEKSGPILSWRFSIYEPL